MTEHSHPDGVLRFRVTEQGKALIFAEDAHSADVLSITIPAELRQAVALDIAGPGWEFVRKTPETSFSGDCLMSDFNIDGNGAPIEVDLGDGIVFESYESHFGRRVELDKSGASGLHFSIPAEKRAEVAAAILGGITDELVERAAKRCLDEWASAFRPSLRWDDLLRVERERYIEHARGSIERSIRDIHEFFDIEPDHA